MISSMTGFGSADGTVGAARIGVELKTVNHRFFNPSIKLPGPLSRWEVEVREALRKRISRGHVTLTVRYDRDDDGGADTGLGIDEARVARYVEQLRGLQARHGLAGDVDIGTILRMPDVMSARETQDEGSVEELVALVERAADELGAMRKAEGARLAGYLRERVDIIAKAVERIAERAPKRLEEQSARLKATVAELAAGVAVDQQRLAQEIAIIAERLDVAEEVDRFDSHLKAFRATLDDSTGEPVGKRLGFLLQELLREANTTGSKANDAQMLADVVVIKEELERMREQVENLE